MGHRTPTRPRRLAFRSGSLEAGRCPQIGYEILGFAGYLGVVVSSEIVVSFEPAPDIFGIVEINLIELGAKLA
jgi:hypothetical protein